MSADICYFDNAATTFPKPSAVWREMERCIKSYGGNPGRGSHTLALRASEKLYETREALADLFGCVGAERVIFTLNTTYALNLAIFGLIEKGDHILISDLEHNSVLRPVEKLKREKGISYSVFKTSGNVIENIRCKIQKNTKALICTHASNITNTVLPIERIGRLLKSRGILFIVDAAQSAGVHRINMESACISALCIPGHKGLLGPQGIGVLLLSQSVSPKPLIWGGSGTLSRDLQMPSLLPEGLEGGTLPTPAAAGLLEGIRYVSQRGLYDIFSEETRIINRISACFERNERIITYSSGRGSIWLFNIKGLSSQKTAQLLAEKGICVRSGLHCAPLAHSTLNTPEDGAVRVSAGPFNTMADADRLVIAVKDILL